MMKMNWYKIAQAEMESDYYYSFYSSDHVGLVPAFLRKMEQIGVGLEQFKPDAPAFWKLFRIKKNDIKKLVEDKREMDAGVVLGPLGIGNILLSNYSSVDLDRHNGIWETISFSKIKDMDEFGRIINE